MQKKPVGGIANLLIFVNPVRKLVVKMSNDKAIEEIRGIREWRKNIEDKILANDDIDYEIQFRKAFLHIVTLLINIDELKAETINIKLICDNIDELNHPIDPDCEISPLAKRVLDTFGCVYADKVKLADMLERVTKDADDYHDGAKVIILDGVYYAEIRQLLKSGKRKE